MQRLLLLAVGVVVGVVGMTLWGPSSAKAQSSKDAERFALSKADTVKSSIGQIPVYHLKDKRTGDCYLVQLGVGPSFSTIVKTGDKACVGF